MVSVHCFSLLVFVCLSASISAASYFYENVRDDISESKLLNQESYYTVPPDFLLGVGSAAYQVEGAWNEDGKGESIQDHFFHFNTPEAPNGDVACDLYHKYAEDVKLVRDMELDVYRISLSWARLLPEGTTNNISKAGVDFYNSFINEMIENGITPMVTLYHWDLPQALQANGGWAGDSSIQDHFVEYAKFAFETFGDRVKWWLTINEPMAVCQYAYDPPQYAPAIPDPGVSPYICAHNTILAHAKTYHLYHKYYFKQQQGKIGIPLVMGRYFVPLNVESDDDREAAERAMIFQFAWFFDPIMFGHYPKIMRERIDANSIAEGRNMSRLPTFTDDERKMLQSAVDYVGINHYYNMATTSGIPADSPNPSVTRDTAVITSVPSKWILGSGISTTTPWGMRDALNWVRKRYGNVPQFVTENGYEGDATDGLNDTIRISYISEYLRATVQAASEDGCNVLGYLVWSLMDSFEWIAGYVPKFGLVQVDFEDSNLTRTPRQSYYFLREIVSTRRAKYVPFNVATTTSSQSTVD